MKFFLCDDNQKVLDFYEQKLKFLCDKHSVDFECFLYASGEKMLADFKKQDSFFGVVFLDIRMPEMDGMTLAKKLRDYGCQSEIIFITISEAHFLSAFDVGAFNYVVKGKTSDRRFEEIFLRAVASAREKDQDFIVFSSNGEHRSIPAKSIYYFEVLKRIITVHYVGGDFDFFSTMEKLENQLFSLGFVRVHRSYLVLAQQIESLTYTTLKLRNGTVLPVGRKYYNAIKDAMEKFFKYDKSL